MADEKDIPAWQRHATDASTQAATQEHDASSSAINRVRSFLDDPAVKDAPFDKKKAFLLSKNVSEDMIYQVMGPAHSHTSEDTDASDQAARQEYEASKLLDTADGSTEAAQQEFQASNKAPQGSSYISTTDGSKAAAQQEFDASNPSTAPTVSPEPTKPEFDASRNIAQPSTYIKTTDGSREAAKQEFDASKATSFSAADFKASPHSTAPTIHPRRDVPPIITYPEFLVQPQKPPPLVTVSRLVNTAYIAGALTASAYALSKWIIAPMSDNLNDARHDLFEHTNDHVHNFNDRLGNLVSTIPSLAKSLPQTPAEYADEDAESITSDPTELFHRDVGTQTSPSLSRRSSHSSEFDTTKPDIVPTKHAARLQVMQSHLSELLEDTEKNGTSNQTLQESINETRHYLDTLVYTPPSYSFGSIDTTSSDASKNKPDAVVALKAEIRGVKGVLLSAKRFPTAGRVGA